jgi:hypothetical protein
MILSHAYHKDLFILLLPAPTILIQTVQSESFIINFKT